MPCPEKFRESLTLFHVDSPIAALILNGYEDLVSASPKPKKAMFFKRALDIMDDKLDPTLVRDIFAYNACCKSGARLKASRAFAKENMDLPLEEKLRKITARPEMFMGAPTLDADGTITTVAVSYRDGETYKCACPNFAKHKYDEPVSKHYCYCCGGHFQFHYEIMLGLKLELAQIVASPLDSAGASPCVIRFRIVEA